MVLRPEDVLHPLEEDMDECNRREKAIDAAIKANSRKYRGGQMTLATDLFSTDVVIRDELARRYRAAGWTVEFKSDQRDGDWVSFTAVDAKPANNEHLYGR